METPRTLIELQAKDLSILRLNKELDEMPEKRAILAARAKLADIGKLEERTDAAVRAIDAASKKIEDEIAAVGAKMDAEQAKLLSGAVSNPKELQAVSLELDSLKRRVESLESDLMAQMQKRETGEAQQAKIRAALDEGRKREVELTDRFRKRGGEILARIEADKRDREALIATLDPAMRERYETTRASHQGVAVAVLNEGTCGACRVQLPSVKVGALMEGPDIATCPSCGRVLIIRGA